MAIFNPLFKCQFGSIISILKLRLCDDDELLTYNYALFVDVGTGGHCAHVPSQDLAINKELPFSFSENLPFL